MSAVSDHFFWPETRGRLHFHRADSPLFGVIMQKTNRNKSQKITKSHEEEYFGCDFFLSEAELLLV